MMFPKRGEISRRMLMTVKPVNYEREAVDKPAHREFSPHQCPKCGKHVGRGKYMHIKTCKGLAT